MIRFNLTQQHKDKIPAYLEKWRKIGSSCEPIDFEKSKSAICLCYEKAGLKKPGLIIKADSPVSALALVIKYRAESLITKKFVDMGHPVKEVISERINDYCQDYYSKNCSSSAWNTVGKIVNQFVNRRSVWAQERILSESATTTTFITSGTMPVVQGHSLSEYLMRGIDEFIKKYFGVMFVGDFELKYFIYGNHEFAKLFFMDFFYKEFEIEFFEMIDGLIQLAETTGWVLPYKNIAIVCDRPKQLMTNNLGQLHNPDGYAISYRDGWGIYIFNGLSIPIGKESFILKKAEDIEIEEIDREGNIEIRRCMIEKMGAENYLKKGKAKLIDQSNQYGELYQKISNHDRINLLRVFNSTPNADGSKKEYVLFVPNNITTVHEAVAWTFGKRPEDYKPQVET